MSEVADVVRARRVLMVFDGTAWFVREVKLIEHDLSRDEKIYRCHKHLGGPFGLEEAIEFIRELARGQQEPVGSRTPTSSSERPPLPGQKG